MNRLWLIVVGLVVCIVIWIVRIKWESKGEKE